MIPTLREKLTKILLDRKIVDQESLQKAIAVQKEKNKPLSDILVEMGLVTKNDLMVILSQELGIPPMNLSRYKIDPEVLRLIPKKTAKHYKILPVSKMGTMLTLAMADPLNIFAIDDIKSLTGFKISPVITTDKDIQDAVSKYYEEDATTAIEKIVSDMEQTADIKMIERAVEEAASSDLLKLTQEAPVIKLTNLLLADAVKARASDVLVEPLENELRVRYRVDGMLQEAPKRPSKALHSAIVSRLKVMSDLDIAEKRLPQDGRFKVKIQGREIDFRISVLPSSKGEKVALRILDKSQAMLDVMKLGFDDQSLGLIKRNAAKPHGMILMSGPTGCGKTTTLYSILTYINSPEKNVVTVEDPVEYVLEGINQVTARPDMGLTFAAALRSILRQDPNIIMIGEIRDPETVDIAIKAALTGHLVLSTLHTTTATGSIVRILNMGVEPFLITSSLLLVGSQRLVRRICQSCKEAYAPHDEAVDALKSRSVRHGATFYRGKGCNECLGTGYRGRVAIAEMLELTPKIKALILEGAQEHRIREVARKEGMRTLRENGVQNILDGVTTLDEVLRVTSGEKELEED